MVILIEVVLQIGRLTDKLIETIRFIIYKNNGRNQNITHK